MQHSGKLESSIRGLAQNLGSGVMVDQFSLFQLFSDSTDTPLTSLLFWDRKNSGLYWAWCWTSMRVDRYAIYVPIFFKTAIPNLRNCPIPFSWSQGLIVTTKIYFSGYGLIHPLNSNLPQFVSLTHTWYQQGLRIPLFFLLPLYSIWLFSLGNHNCLFVTNLIFKVYRQRKVSKFIKKLNCFIRSTTQTFPMQPILSFFKIISETAQMASPVWLFFLILVSKYFLCSWNIKKLRFFHQIQSGSGHLIIQSTCSFSDYFHKQPDGFHCSLAIHLLDL